MATAPITAAAPVARSADVTFGTGRGYWRHNGGIAIDGPQGETLHEASVRWTGSKDDLRAHRVSVGGVEFAGSCSPEWGGDPAAADPEGLFVAALSACHMLWFLDLARRERLRVRSYEDAAEGTMDTRRFTRVVLRPRVEFEADVSVETARGLHEAAHERCFIANSVSCPVEIDIG